MDILHRCTAKALIVYAAHPQSIIPDRYVQAGAFHARSDFFTKLIANHVFDYHLTYTPLGHFYEHEPIKLQRLGTRTRQIHNNV